MTQPPGSAARDAEPLIVLGEVRSCLLPTSTALSRPMVQDLLTLVPGRRVPARDRPIPIAQSATTAVGVDCDLAIERGNGRDPRAIGTVAVQAVVVGGRILQSSARTEVVVAQQKRRREWSHYLSRVGMVEVVTRTAPDIAHRLAEGYLAGETPAHTLDLASICERLLARVRRDTRLDRRPPLLAPPTRLRWIARVGEVDEPRLAMHLVNDTVRTARVLVPDAALLPEVRRFCEDLAVHDWLLTTTAAAVQESDRFPSGSAESVEALTPVLTELAHLWMPGAHLGEPVRSLWAQLQREPGFTNQWNAYIGHIRDRTSVAMLHALRASRVGTTEW
ncbi:MAG TPA: SCO2521 family protein [Nocardia sp.]|uniref:SCO2521 family protein n=1 Tax=Nocardia TaxID=1817 RepID=UPI0024588CAC|nr:MULTISPECIES: SCO2521 family protein [Nocardia]HLS79455.1 SCO2521 family protein [Nocardia sp.]